MRKFARVLPLLLLSFLFLFSPPVEASENRRYVVRFREDTPPQTMRARMAERNLEPKQVLEDSGIAVFETDDDQKIQQLKQSPDVEAIDLNHFMHIPTMQVPEHSWPPPSVTPTPMPPVTDPIYVNSQWNIRRLFADQAWAQGYTASHNTVVAILDTGIANNHPDLGANIVYEKCFTALQPTCQPYPQIPANMGGNHGTIVAGVLGSLINGVGTVGVAPNVGIANYNVSEYDPDGVPIVYDSSMWAAVEDAAKQRFEVISLSAGDVLQLPLSVEDQERVNNWKRVLKKAKNKGVVFVTASGNSSTNLDDPSILMVPCELDNVLCVGATNIRPQPTFPQVGFFDEATFYTGYGSKVDFAAPGGDCGGPDFNTCITAPDPRYFIWTTTASPNATCAATQSCPTSYTASIGTSFSAPQAAGVAALVMDAYRARTGHGMNPEEVGRVLRRTAEDINTTPKLGAGMLNAWEAVDAVNGHGHGGWH